MTRCLLPRLVLTTLVLTGIGGNAHVCPANDVWIEDSYEDFADGHLDAAGQNLFVSRDGAVRTIHRFDLNDDGFIDLVFNSTHDTVTDLPASVAAFGDQHLEFKTLPVGGSLQVAIADLNRDGHADAVFCPNRGGVQQGRGFITIAWGGADGWRASRLMRSLPVHEARRIALADLNADAWPDIVVLNGPAWQHGQPQGDIVRVYWGSMDGYLLTRRSDYGVASAVDLLGSDFDGNGAADVAVLGRDAIELLWAGAGEGSATNLEHSQFALPNGQSTCMTALRSTDGSACDLVVATKDGKLLRIADEAGRSFGAPSPIANQAATHLTSGDLDADGHVDLVLTNFESGRAAGGEAAAADQLADQAVLVLWGTGSGFSNEPTQIALANVAATAIGDLNADGVADIAAAVYQGSETFTTDSVILLGRGNRQFERSRDDLTTTGASGVAVAPAEGRIPARAVFCSSVGGTLREEVPLQLYWGGAAGFSEERQTLIPFASGYESTAADFNGDGHVDLIELNSGHSGAISLRDPTLGINIYWGAAEGFDFANRRTVLREENLGTSNTADLNRDGYLDIVAGQFSASSNVADTQLLVYYGGADGFSSDRLQAIDCPGRSISTSIADFNQDEWLDVAVAATTAEKVRILWGSADGFHAEKISEVPLHSAIDLETADLNADGWADLIVGCYADDTSHAHDLGSHVLWGSSIGFHQSNSQFLPGLTPIGHCIADFDADGHLDIFSPHYHANGTRETLPCYLFWGSDDGFAPENKTELICDSADDALAADFDHDGLIDLAVVNHARNGAHHTVSRVFYNDGARFTVPRIQTLPTHGPHWMWQEDMGHILHRRWEQRYESSVFEFDGECCSGSLQFDADVPHGTRLSWRVRAVPHADQLEQCPWKIVNDRFDLQDSDRIIQYAAVFESDNGDRYPVLKRVEIRLEP